MFAQLCAPVGESDPMSVPDSGSGVRPALAHFSGGIFRCFHFCSYDFSIGKRSGQAAVSERADGSKI